MEGGKRKWKDSRDVFRLLQQREIHSELNRAVKQGYQFTDSLVKRLGLETELEGHQGCVNCLQWSSDGRHLASGSDDTNVIYWDPFRHENIQVIPTPHIGNIFSVKFLGTNDTIIATGAGDCRVIVQSVEDAVSRSPPLLDCGCHVGRVKRLANAPDQPMLFWSAGEDGLVIQYDMREPHECPAKSQVFLDLSYSSEMKCIAVNPTRPYLIAVGANDCFVRLYDRRKVKISSLSLEHTFDQRFRTPGAPPTDPACVQYFSPGHLTREYSFMSTFKLAVTYVAFNAAGTELLANLGCEQVYLYDVLSGRRCGEEIAVPPKVNVGESWRGNGSAMKVAKECCLMETHSYDYVKYVHNHVIHISIDSCACDYLKRANYLYQRKWIGDIYAALRDYLYVIHHFQPSVPLAYSGLMRCLVAMRWKREALAWLQVLRERLPTHPQSAGMSQEVEEMEEAPRSSTPRSSTPRSPNNRQGDGEPPSNGQEHYKLVSEEEEKLRLAAVDYAERYLGHCNTTTDIKEANFLGEDGNYIIAGSDDGLIFIWERKTSKIVRALFGDYSIVNCVQPHPTACLVASSGIDPAVKIWSPGTEDGTNNPRIIHNVSPAVENNQARLEMDPFETMLANMGYRFRDPPFEGLSLHDVPTCRTS